VGGGYTNGFYAREFWRFVRAAGILQVGGDGDQLSPMQKPASFNLEAVKEKIDEMMKSREGQ
jgi:hypothetical protein